MLDYYERTSDTAKYLQNAVKYYNAYLMTVNVDSIRMIDSNRVKSILESSPGDTVKRENKFQIRKTVSFAPFTQTFMNELNSGAWSFYKMTNDTALLSVAVKWIEKALEFLKHLKHLILTEDYYTKQEKKLRQLKYRQKLLHYENKEAFPQKITKLFWKK